MSEYKTIEVPQMWGNEKSKEAEKSMRKRQVKASKAGLETCEFCGRGVRQGFGWWVHAVNGGTTLIDLSEQYVDEGGDMGWWMLGPECGKQIPKEFRSRKLGGDK